MSTKIYIIAQLLLSLFILSSMTYANNTDLHLLQGIAHEAGRGSINGEAGIYMESIEYDKRGFIEDGETVELHDSSLLVPYLQINYSTAGYTGFSFGSGLTAYTHVNGEDEEDT